MKQLSRLDYICGVKVTADPKVAGNYLRAARQSKARHEFGVYLGSAGQAFQLFQPTEGMLGNLRERWRRFWVAAEPPQGHRCPASGNLFPQLLGGPGLGGLPWPATSERMAAFEKAR